MALLAAFLGWMFDGFEMGLFPLIGPDALKDLLVNTVAPEDMAKTVSSWFTVIIATFLVGAATGGVFFGWLGDRIGRVRAMTFSIFTYAIFTGLCGFATEAWQIALLRFVASLGMGGEWALGVALVNELWTKGSRAWVAGAIGAAANIGYLLVALLSLGMSAFIGTITGWSTALGASDDLNKYLFDHGAWRFLMISGAFPAILIFLIRIFVPESDKWEEEKKAGSTSFWSTPDLLGVLFGATVALFMIYAWSPMGFDATWATIVTITGFGMVIWGFLLPVRRYLHRAASAGTMTHDTRITIRKNLLIGATLAGIALLGTWGAAQHAPKWSGSLNLHGTSPVEVKAYTQLATAFGACVITLLTPVLADILNRRLTYLLCCILAMASSITFFQTNTEIGTWFFISAFLMGGLTASFYGFFPLYLPELFPTAVRATGQGFCFNVGRIIAAVGGLQFANLEKGFGGAVNAYTILCSVYIVGMVLVWFAPETKGKKLV
ncbi:sugar transport protein [Roseimicrobium gellanilyticum]|uniref:Sugar transport protein n=2 Tax=Roseimicrobium gellanilyticum TaxID=748857 RepID=A0A366HS56_9BACT|nr:sugar transport protein [Roseimicrobium gellanilyticum]